MKHSARVLGDATLENSGSFTANVEIASISACQRCARGSARQGCGISLFNHGAQAVHLVCKSSLPVVRNQQVTVEFDDHDSGWLWLLAGAYGLPLLGFILPALAMPVLFGAFFDAVDNPGLHEFITAMAAFAGLAGGVIAWRSIEPGVVARVEKGLCLQSGRIVAVSQPLQFTGESR